MSYGFLVFRYKSSGRIYAEDCKLPPIEASKYDILVKSMQFIDNKYKRI